MFRAIYAPPRRGQAPSSSYEGSGYFNKCSPPYILVSSSNQFPTVGNFSTSGVGHCFPEGEAHRLMCHYLFLNFGLGGPREPETQRFHYTVVCTVYCGRCSRVLLRE